MLLTRRARTPSRQAAGRGSYKSFGDEVGEGGELAEIDAEGAFGAVVGEGYFEGFRGWYRVSLDGGAGDILLLVVGGAGGDVLVYHETPLVFAGDGVNAIGADGDGGIGEASWGFGAWA